MDTKNPFEDLQAKLSSLFANSPAKDIEASVKALLQQGFTRLDLATREQLDLQAALLARARDRLTELESRVAVLEAQRAPGTTAESVAEPATDFKGTAV